MNWDANSSAAGCELTSRQASERNSPMWRFVLHWRSPQCEIELEDEFATATVAQVLPQGARFELKLPKAATEPMSIALEWVAYESDSIEMARSCHSERSEESAPMKNLRFAQNDIRRQSIAHAGLTEEFSQRGHADLAKLPRRH